MKSLIKLYIILFFSMTAFADETTHRCDNHGGAYETCPICQESMSPELGE